MTAPAGVPVSVVAERRVGERRVGKRPQHDLGDDALWGEWLDRACAALGIDRALADVALVHTVSREIAHGFVRPMAPVGPFLIGVALGQRVAQARASGETVGEAEAAALRAELASALRTTYPA